MKFIWLPLVALALAFALTPLVQALAHRFGVVDKRGDTKHRPTPLLGGVAIYVAFSVCLMVGDVLTPGVSAIFAGATLIFLVGVLQDCRGVPAPVRLIVQFLAVGLLLRAGVVLTFLPPTWWGVMGEWALTFLWVVGITNAFNFLDGLDGLATGSAAVNGFVLGLYAYTTWQPALALPALVLVGAAIGFLPHNYKAFRRDEDANIFLGDSGSTFLGFMLASMAVMGDWAEGSPKDLIVPVLILAVPIFDMILTTVVRFREGQVRNPLEWVVYTGRDHFHHRLLGLGMRKKEAVAIIFLVNLCLGISAILLDGADAREAFLVLTQGVLIFSILGYAIVVINHRQRARDAAQAETSAASEATGGSVAIEVDERPAKAG